MSCTTKKTKEVQKYYYRLRYSKIITYCCKCGQMLPEFKLKQHLREFHRNSNIYGRCLSCCDFKFELLSDESKTAFHRISCLDEKRKEVLNTYKLKPHQAAKFYQNFINEHFKGEDPLYKKKKTRRVRFSRKDQIKESIEEDKETDDDDEPSPIECDVVINETPQYTKLELDFILSTLQELNK